MNSKKVRKIRQTMRRTVDKEFDRWVANLQAQSLLARIKFALRLVFRKRYHTIRSASTIQLEKKV